MKIRAWRQLRLVKHNESFSLSFFLPESEYMELGLRSVESHGSHEAGGAPPPSWTGCGPPGLHLLQGFFIISEKLFREVSGHSENFCFCTKITPWQLKTASVRVSSIQIMQVRVQNKGKSVWKSRYDGDVSNPPSLNLCLSSSNSVDKLKVIKKNFYKLCLLLLL